jgi:hypothetical protein
MFVQITYDSRANARITDQDIAKITTSSLVKNLANDLTGYLYYDDRRFLHILEGRTEQVSDAMKRITSNPMHHSLKVRLMNRNPERNFQEWPFGTLAAGDPELRRITKNMGFRDLFDANVLDVIKILKRVAGRKYRMMNSLEKQSLTDPRKMIGSKPSADMPDNVLGLRR